MFLTDNRDQIQEYFFGCSHNIAEKILFIRRAKKLDEYSEHLQDLHRFGHVFQGITGIHRGETITIIAGGVGPSQIGDAVYALNKSNAVCIFSGTCGGIKRGLAIGDYFLAERAISGDGYGILFGYEPFAVIQPDPSIFTQLYQAFGSLGIQAKTGAVFSTSSVVRETEQDFWELVDPVCDAIEMECAAFYIAALKSTKLAAAYFWVTDASTLGRSFYDKLSAEEIFIKQERFNKMIETDLRVLSSI